MIITYVQFPFQMQCENTNVANVMLQEKQHFISGMYYAKCVRCIRDDEWPIFWPYIFL